MYCLAAASFWNIRLKVVLKFILIIKNYFTWLTGIELQLKLLYILEVVVSVMCT